MKPHSIYRVLWVACFAVALFLATSSARAEFVNPLITVQVSAGGHTGIWELEVSNPSDPYSWRLPEPVDIYSDDPDNVFLGTIDSMDLGLIADPQVALGFAFTAGPAPAVFGVSSGLVVFPMNNPTGFATASLTVTDNDGNGATAAGLFAGSKVYQATLNGATPFANLVSTVVAPIDDSATSQERHPGVGSVLIPGIVNTISASYSFTLTANDSASGTSRFNVVPEPSTVALALIGSAALVACWRRRRK